MPDCSTHEEWVELADQIYDSICAGTEDHEEAAALFEAETLGALGGLAEEIAEEMYEENFSSHRGTGSIAMATSTGVGAFHLYDSQPHASS